MALTPRSVFRYFKTDGVPSSGKHKPVKAEIIQLLEQLFGVSRGGWVVAQTRAALISVTPEDENDGGVVLDDPNPAYNGYYSRVAGVWDFGRGFPDTFALVTLTGSGTAQTGTVKPGVSPASIEVFFAEVTTPNTGPLKLTIGGVQRDVVNAAGNALSPSEWTGGVQFRINPEGKFQLINEAGAAVAAAASASEARDEADRAEGEADRATARAADALGSENAALVYKTQAELAALAAGAALFSSVGDGEAGTANGDTFLVSTEAGVQVYQNVSGDGQMQGWLGKVAFPSLDDLRDFTGGLGPAGTIVEADGVRYRVLPPATVHPDETTAGGVLLEYEGGGDWIAMNRKLLNEANRKIMDRSGTETLKIVCVGDSLTYGHDTVSADKIAALPGHSYTRAPVQYPERLEDRLAALMVSDVEVVNRGFSGDTAKRSFNRWTANPTSDLALIMLGINDSVAVDGATYDEYVRYIEKLIQRHIRWGCGVVILTPTAINSGSSPHLSSLFGQAARGLAAAYGCPVFESEAQTIYSPAAEIYSDTTHFNAVGYQKFADAVAAFLLSGALSRSHPRNISSETYMQLGRMSEGVGCHVKGGSYSVNATNSYMINGHIAVLPTDAKASFSFYLDVEAADVSFHGSIPADAIFSMCDPLDGKGVSRALSKFDSRSVVRETVPYTAQSASTGGSGPIHLGTLVGRGWKTVTIENGGSTNLIINGLRVSPVEQRAAAADNSLFAPAVLQSFVRSIPENDPGEYTVGVAQAIPSVVLLPMPDALLVKTGVVSHWAWPGVAKLIYRVIGPTGSGTDHAAGLAEFRIHRSGSGYNNLSLIKAFESTAGMLLPSSVTMGWTAYTNDTFDPGSVTLANGSNAPGSNNAFWLALNFASGYKPAFFHFELEALSRRNAPLSGLN